MFEIFWSHDQSQALKLNNEEFSISLDDSNDDSKVARFSDISKDANEINDVHSNSLFIDFLNKYLIKIATMWKKSLKE